VILLFLFLVNPVLDVLYSHSGSEAMSLVQLFVPAEVAHDTVAELGELGNVEFKDVCFHYISAFFSLSPTASTPAAQPRCKPLPTLLRRRDPPHRRDGTPCALLCCAD
jgi:hypothetical protein